MPELHRAGVRSRLDGIALEIFVGHTEAMRLAQESLRKQAPAIHHSNGGAFKRNLPRRIYDGIGRSIPGASESIQFDPARGDEFVPTDVESAEVEAHSIPVRPVGAS